jgi:PAS domain S-box-containing protein
MNTRSKIISLSFVLGAIVWAIDSVVDWVFYRDHSNAGFTLFDVSGPELNMRLFILFCFVVFGFIISKIISKKDKVEQELRISENRFKEVAKYAQEWIWEVDTEGMYTYSSTAIESILGYKPEEIINKKCFFDFFDSDTKEESKKSVLNDFSEKKSFKNYLNKNIHKNGNSVWLSTSGVPILTDEGKLKGYRGIDENVTESKLAEDSLIALSTTFSAFSSVDLFEKISKHLTETLNIDYAFVGELIDTKDGVRVLGGLGKGKPLDQFEYDLENTPCENVIGKSVCSHPKSVQKLFPKDHLLVEMGIEAYVGAPIFDREGVASGIMVLLDTKPIQRPNVAKSLLQIFIERISVEIERLKTEEALLESKEKYKSLLNRIQAAVVVHGADTQILASNPKAHELLGLTENQLLGKSVIRKVCY